MFFRIDWAFYSFIPAKIVVRSCSAASGTGQKDPRLSELFSFGQGFKIESLILPDDISTSFDWTYFPCSDYLCRLIDLSKLSIPKRLCIRLR